MSNYLQAMSIAIPAIALAWGIFFAFVWKEPQWLSFIVVLVGGQGMVIAGQNFQTTGKIGALLGCYACMLIAGLELRKLLGRDQMTRRERKAWQMLMGESLWGMLRYDPRLIAWRNR